MHTTDIITKQLFAEQDAWLTQAALLEGQVRTFVQQVICGEDNVSEWTEWTDEQKTQWLTEHPDGRATEEDALPDDDMLLLRAKNQKLADITAYDSSEAVNAFTYHGNTMWIAYDDRLRLKNRLDAEEAMGKTETHIWYNGTAFDLNIAQCRQMLYALEDYAAQCFDTTQTHRNNVNALETVEAVQDYDITTNYPTKLSF